MGQTRHKLMMQSVHPACCVWCWVAHVCFWSLLDLPIALSFRAAGDLDVEVLTNKEIRWRGATRCIVSASWRCRVFKRFLTLWRPCSDRGQQLVPSSGPTDENSQDCDFLVTTPVQKSMPDTVWWTDAAVVEKVNKPVWLSWRRLGLTHRSL